MKKRKFVTRVCLILPLLVICVMLIIKQQTLDYNNVENVCYNIQQAGELIPPRPELCEKYELEKDRYGSVILTVTGKEGEEVSCEMTPDYQIVDKIKRTINFKYLVLSLSESSVLAKAAIICILFETLIIPTIIASSLLTYCVLDIIEVIFGTDSLKNTKLVKAIKNKVKKMNNKH